ncbi:hypothetical protein [Polyangium sp. 15x6]|uniref:hypothetical protein n=1 Tax=Polyangium sp. 15x6 TaxID=3042687 RepID=UPI00249AB138|nr:hypothetical protein [Polyangium sp. 15x6]MDI3289399.1 hypothetical protein [Polyangium sp. 15x6]
MVMHIEDGKYTLQQNRKEVGLVVVTGGVEHWYLYRKVPTDKDATHGIYTAPSDTARLGTPGSFGTAEGIETTFVPETSFDPKSFDPKTFRAPAGTDAKYIEARCTHLGEVTAARVTRIATMPGNVGQIDWGPYQVWQNGKLVGYVDVAPYREAGATSVRAHESWMLFTSGFPSDGAHGSYTPPGASGGSYGVQFVRLTSPSGHAATLIPTGTVYETILADCNVPTR